MSGLWLNGEEVTLDVEPGTPVRQLVEQQVSELLPADEIVCEIKVDGRSCDIERARWGEFARLDLTTGAPRVLLRQGLEQSDELVAQICQRFHSCAGNLRQGRQDEFRRQFVTVIDELLDFLRFLALTQAFLGRRQEVMQQFEKRLQERVDELMQVQQSGDTVLMADLLEYEMVPLFSGWPGVSRVLLDGLEGDGDGDSR